MTRSNCVVNCYSGVKFAGHPEQCTRQAASTHRRLKCQAVRWKTAAPKGILDFRFYVSGDMITVFKSLELAGAKAPSSLCWGTLTMAL